MLSKHFANSFISLIMAGIIFSCAPKVQDSELKKPDVPELKTNDVALNQIYKSPFATVNWTIKKLDLKKTFSQTQIQTLFEISEKLSDLNANEKAIDLFNLRQNENLTQQKNVTKEYKNTYYLQLVEEQTRKSLKKSVSDIEQQLLDDTDQIDKIIDSAANNSVNKSKPENDLATHIQIAKHLITEITDKIQATDLFAELKKQTVEQIKLQADHYISVADDFNSQSAPLTILTLKIKLIETYLEKLNITLEGVDQQSLQSGKKLGASIDAIADSKNALQTLALTWQMLTVEDRDQYFKPANQKLYDLLNKKSDKDIQCLTDGNCTGLISKIILNIGVYPALDSYGIDKIKSDLNQAAIGYLNRKINAIAFEKLNTLTAKMKTDIRASVEKNITDVQKFKDNFKINLATGLKNKLNSTALNLYVLSDAQSDSVLLQEQLTLATNELYTLPTATAEQIKNKQFNLIEKVISLIDFSNQKQTLLQNGLTDFLKNPKELFLTSELKNTTNTILIKDQAASLKFLSQMITATADWKPGPFDHGLVEINAQDLISDFKSDQLNQSLFPKASLFNICFSYAVQVLKQIQSEKSLVYLVDNDSQRIPISDYLSGKNHPTVALGAASDQKNNRLTNKTNAADLADLIGALSAFSAATKDIEQSQSEILNDPAVKAQILSANKNVNLLILTLSNFISSQMVGPKNLVADNYDFESKQLGTTYSLQSQVAAIHALVKAYETTGIDIYLLSAKELYYALNKNYFDPQLKFYKTNMADKSENTSGAQLNSDVLNTLNQLLPLRKYLVLSSQVQFDRIFENWYVAILL
jgi:hypothetical protein